MQAARAGGRLAQDEDRLTHHQLNHVGEHLGVDQRQVALRVLLQLALEEPATVLVLRGFERAARGDVSFSYCL